MGLAKAALGGVDVVMKITWLHLFVYGLACFRMALLLSDDDGPWGMFRKFRAYLKKEAKHNTTLRKSEVHKGVSCIRCDSIWVAAFVAAYAYHHDTLANLWWVPVIDIVLLCMALSAIAILWNRVPTRQ